VLNAGAGAQSYAWNTGETSQQITVDKTGDYSVAVTDAGGCSNHDSVRVTVNPVPAVDIAPDQAICQGDSVVLDAGNTGNAYLWSDGSTGRTLTARDSGLYWVRVTSASGCSAADTMALRVNPLPIVNLGSDTTICYGDTLTLAIGGDGGSVLWSDNSTSRMLKIGQSGVYSVKVTNAFGCPASDTLQVTVNPLPTVAFGKDTAVCAGNAVTLDAGNKGDSYAWSTGETSQTISVNKQGTYSVAVTDSNGCTASYQTMAIMRPLPTVDLGGDTSICTGTLLDLDAGNAGARYLWSTGATSQTIDVSRQGTYWVTVTDSNSCSADDSVTVKVEPLPEIDGERKASLCEGQSMKLDPSDSNGGYTYQWQDGSTTPSITVTEGGSYWVIISNGKCLVRDTMDISMLKNSLPLLSPSGQICPGDSVTIDAGSADAIAYRWSTGATTPSITVNAAGSYAVQIKGKYCDFVREDTVLISTHPLPSLKVTADDISICKGEVLHLLASGDNTDYYRWEDDNSEGNMHTVYDPGLYKVQAFNQCGVTEDSIQVMEGGACTASLFMPNAFSPNHDGKNDSFGPKVIVGVKDFEMRIFNRWGQLLFLSNSVEDRWDGTYKGKPCDVGGYVWWIKYTEPNSSKPLFMKGAVTLVR
jgi:gliding motility-associated-like protein